MLHHWLRVGPCKHNNTTHYLHPLSETCRVYFNIEYTFEQSLFTEFCFILDHRPMIDKTIPAAIKICPSLQTHYHDTSQALKAKHYSCDVSLFTKAFNNHNLIFCFKPFYFFSWVRKWVFFPGFQGKLSHFTKIFLSDVYKRQILIKRSAD